jgi:hypothetical protein
MRVPARLFWAILPLIVGLIVPSLIAIAGETILGRIHVRAAVMDVMSRQFAEGENLFLLSLIGLIPFALLSMFTFLVGRRLPPQRLASVSLGGLTGILVYMIPAHLRIWYPLDAGQHVASTDAIAFLFIPFYCIPMLIAGLLVGWILSLIPGIRAR